MAKLVDAPSSGGGAARCAGSNPVPGTMPFQQSWRGIFYSGDAGWMVEQVKKNDVFRGGTQ